MSPAPTAQAHLATAERRRHCRYPITVRAEYATRHGRGQGTTCDVSSGGLFIKTRTPLIQGERIQVLLDWPALLDGRHALRLDIKGRVLRTSSRGVAIRILSYSYRLAPKCVTSLRKVG